MEEKFTVQIPVNLRKPLRVIAAENEGTIQSTVAGLLESAINEINSAKN